MREEAEAPLKRSVGYASAPMLHHCLACLVQFPRDMFWIAVSPAFHRSSNRQPFCMTLACENPVTLSWRSSPMFWLKREASPYSKHRPSGAILRVNIGEGASVITGSQIQIARSLLGWDRKHLARACKLRTETLARAESVEGEAVDHNGAARVIPERASIEFPQALRPA